MATPIKEVPANVPGDGSNNKGGEEDYAVRTILITVFMGWFDGGGVKRW